MQTTMLKVPPTRLDPGRVPAYLPLEAVRVPRPVDRIAFLRAACADRDVLDLGALDETAFGAKQGRGTWLHGEIATVARQVVGVDSSPKVPPEGLRTAPNATIRRADGARLGELLDRLDLRPDVVVAGELIEHLDNPLAFLTSLREEPRLRGARLVLTTPNATAVHNVLIALAGRESTHHDHLCILSYKTLTTLMRRAGFERWRLTPYFARFPEMIERQQGWRRRLVVAGERTVNGLEWCWPLLAFGWVVEADC